MDYPISKKQSDHNIFLNLSAFFLPTETEEILENFNIKRN